jgi:hypothetical protein
MTVQPRRCKDCVIEGVTTLRPTPHPGPRCSTHHRAWRQRAKNLAHERHLAADFELTPEQYWMLYAYQNGLCFICRKASGKSKRLAVEHEHGLCDDHPPDHGCLRCIRALCCGRCNRLVAFLDVEALCRAIELLTDPPARKLFGSSLS